MKLKKRVFQLINNNFNLLTLTKKKLTKINYLEFVFYWSQILVLVCSIVVLVVNTISGLCHMRNQSFSLLNANAV